MKKFISILLALLIIVNLTPVTLANAIEENLDNNLENHHEEDYSYAAQQLEQLYELGYIEEKVTEEDLKEQAQDNLVTLNNDEILSEGTYLVGIDTATEELIDTNELIDTATDNLINSNEIFNEKSHSNSSVDNMSSNVSAKSSSLLWYTVAFKTWITGAGTTSSKISHSVEVTGVYGIGERPKNYSIIARIKRSTSPNGTYSDVQNQTKTVGLKEVVTISYSIAATYYWKSDSDAWANYSDASYPADAKQEGPWLLNKKGVKYPDYTDPGSKKVMTKPASTKWSSVSTAGCALTTTERTAYRNWYDKEYKVLDWSQYEIHHIRPCKWGGTKDYSNLIPLPTTFHRSTVSPWWVNY